MAKNDPEGREGGEGGLFPSPSRSSTSHCPNRLGHPLPPDIAAARPALALRSKRKGAPSRVIAALAGDADYGGVWCKGHSFNAMATDSLESILITWGEHGTLRDPTGAVSLFRSPSQRIMSAWHFNKQVIGSGKDDPPQTP